MFIRTRYEVGQAGMYRPKGSSHKYAARIVGITIRVGEGKEKHVPVVLYSVQWTDRYEYLKLEHFGEDCTRFSPFPDPYEDK